MAFDTSFNITFDQEDLIFKKENTERFRAVENSGLQIGGHRIYFNNSNTYLNTNNGNDGYEFVNNNNTVLSGSLYGDVSKYRSKVLILLRLFLCSIGSKKIIRS